MIAKFGLVFGVLFGIVADQVVEKLRKDVAVVLRNDLFRRLSLDNQVVAVVG